MRSYSGARQVCNFPNYRYTFPSNIPPKKIIRCIHITPRLRKNDFIAFWGFGIHFAFALSTVWQYAQTILFSRSSRSQFSDSHFRSQLICTHFLCFVSMQTNPQSPQLSAPFLIRNFSFVLLTHTHTHNRFLSIASPKRTNCRTAQFRTHLFPQHATTGIGCLSPFYRLATVARCLRKEKSNRIAAQHIRSDQWHASNIAFGPVLTGCRHSCTKSTRLGNTTR